MMYSQSRNEGPGTSAEPSDASSLRAMVETVRFPSMGARPRSYGEVDHRQGLLDWLTTEDAERAARALVATDRWLDAAELVSETYLAVTLQSTAIRVDRPPAVGRRYLSFTHRSIVRRHAARRRDTVSWDARIEEHVTDDPAVDALTGWTSGGLDQVLDRHTLDLRHRSETRQLLDAETDSEFEAIAAIAALIVVASGDADHLVGALGAGRAGSQSAEDRHLVADLIDGRRPGTDRSAAERQRDSRLAGRVRRIAGVADQGEREAA
jgi:hypothetical protein